MQPAPMVSVPLEGYRRVAAGANTAQVRIPKMGISYSLAGPKPQPLIEPSKSPKEAIVAALDRLDRPWSRRLLTLDAASRVGEPSLVALVDVLQRSDDAGWPMAGVYPGEDGGLRIEWRANGEHTVYEVDADGAIYAGHFDFAGGADADIETSDAVEAVRFLGDHLHA